MFMSTAVSDSLCASLYEVRRWVEGGGDLGELRQVLVQCQALLDACSPSDCNLPSEHACVGTSMQAVESRSSDFATKSEAIPAWPAGAWVKEEAADEAALPVAGDSMPASGDLLSASTFSASITGSDPAFAPAILAPALGPTLAHSTVSRNHAT